MEANVCWFKTVILCYGCIITLYAIYGISYLWYIFKLQRICIYYYFSVICDTSQEPDTGTERYQMNSVDLKWKSRCDKHRITVSRLSHVEDTYLYTASKKWNSGLITRLSLHRTAQHAASCGTNIIKTRRGQSSFGLWMYWIIFRSLHVSQNFSVYMWWRLDLLVQYIYRKVWAFSNFGDHYIRIQTQDLIWEVATITIQTWVWGGGSLRPSQTFFEKYSIQMSLMVKLGTGIFKGEFYTVG